MCQPCPDGSSSSDPLSTSCTCDTGRATAGGSNTTTGDECSGEWIYRERLLDVEGVREPF